jgi:hypothetical protein
MKYAVTEETLNTILQYLGTRPFAEVMNIVPLVQAAELIEEEESLVTPDTVVS